MEDPIKKLTAEEFAAEIKSKYPQYNDVEDSVLVEKILQKYPQYADRVDLDQKKKTSPSSTESAGVSEEEITTLDSDGLYNRVFNKVPEFSTQADEPVQQNEAFSDTEQPEKVNTELAEMGTLQLDPDRYNFDEDNYSDFELRTRAAMSGAVNMIASLPAHAMKSIMPLIMSDEELRNFNKLPMEARD